MAPSRPRHSHSPQISWRTGARPQRRHARRGGRCSLGRRRPRGAAARQVRPCRSPRLAPAKAGPPYRTRGTAEGAADRAGPASRPRNRPNFNILSCYGAVTVQSNRKEQIRPDGRAAGRRTLQGLALGPVVVLISVEAAMAAPGEISALQLLPGSAETAEIGSGNLHFLVFERPRGQAR